MTAQPSNGDVWTWNSSGTCPPHQFADGGVCTRCELGEVARGRSCEACPDGTVPDPSSNECVGCAGNEVSKDGRCVPCGVGNYADHSANVCAICPADATVDVSAQIQCGPVSVETESSQVVDDPCPNDYWVEIVRLDAVQGKGCDYIALSAVPSSTDTEEECDRRSVNMSVFDETFRSLFSGQSAGVWEKDESQGDGGGGLDLDLSSCVYSLRHAWRPEDAADFGIMRVRVEAKESPPIPWPATLKVQIGDTPPK